MKKTALLLASIIILSLCACSNTVSNNSSKNSQSVTNEAEAVSNKSEWKQFITEYETWVDKYIETTKKYKENPSDMSILADYTKIMSELTNWTTKTEEIQKELSNASPSELAEYTAEIARIASKIAQAAQ